MRNEKEWERLRNKVDIKMCEVEREKYSFNWNWSTIAWRLMLIHFSLWVIFSISLFIHFSWAHVHAIDAFLLRAQFNVNISEPIYYIHFFLISIAAAAAVCECVCVFFSFPNSILLILSFYFYSFLSLSISLTIYGEHRTAQ